MNDITFVKAGTTAADVELFIQDSDYTIFYSQKKYGKNKKLITILNIED